MPETYKNVRRTVMGASRPYWAPIKTESDSALPTYDTGMAFSEFIKLTENLSLAETEFYSDDTLSENAKEFKYCELTYDNKGLSDEIMQKMFGMDYTDGVLTYGADDNAPFGGFGYYRTLMDKAVKYYEGVFYPKVKGALSGDTTDTRGENVSFAGTSTSLTAYACKDTRRTWKKTQIFKTAEEAEGWVKTQLGITGT